jgi:hypothetical protein
MNKTEPRSADFLRAVDVPRRYTVIKRSTWMALIASGAVASTKIGRARVLRVVDVEAFLAGRAQGAP